jgi:hydrogenase/urease accessory protein HupE
VSKLYKAFCLLLAGSLLVGLSGIRLAHSHEARPAYLEINETAPGHYTVLWRTPVLAGARLPVVLRFPKEVRNLNEPLVQHLSDSLLERRWIDAGSQGLTGHRIDFPGLQLTITDVVVRLKLLDGRSWMATARPSQPWVQIEATRGTWATALDFLRQGIEHILSGADHLLFVFGLLLIVRTPWMLMKTVTAFTVAHSITLAAATLGYVRPPAPPIEAAIALSILFLGHEIVRAYQGGTSFTIRHPWVAAFAFGLLHGFGFASALSTAGLPPTAIPLALVSFNIGVEIGQLAFVTAMLLLGYGLRQLRMTWPRPAELLPAYVVGTFGAFWLVQRLTVM